MSATRRSTSMWPSRRRRERHHDWQALLAAYVASDTTPGLACFIGQHIGQRGDTLFARSKETADQEATMDRRRISNRLEATKVITVRSGTGAVVLALCLGSISGQATANAVTESGQHSSSGGPIAHIISQAAHAVTAAVHGSNPGSSSTNNVVKTKSVPTSNAVTTNAVKSNAVTTNAVPGGTILNALGGFVPALIGLIEGSPVAAVPAAAVESVHAYNAGVTAATTAAANAANAAVAAATQTPPGAASAALVASLVGGFTYPLSQAGPAVDPDRPAKGTTNGVLISSMTSTSQVTAGAAVTQSNLTVMAALKIAMVSVVPATEICVGNCANGQPLQVTVAPSLPTTLPINGYDEFGNCVSGPFGCDDAPTPIPTSGAGSTSVGGPAALSPVSAILNTYSAAAAAESSALKAVSTGAFGANAVTALAAILAPTPGVALW
jgi:hypothetical protein